LELTLKHYDFVKILPSTISISAIYLIINKDVENINILMKLTNININDCSLITCIKLIKEKISL
jgi:hypothetical protein